MTPGGLPPATPTGAPADGVAKRLAAVRERINAATRRAERPVDSVRLIAVSKRHPLETIAAAYAAGQRDFGESYVQELCDKAQHAAALPDLRLHMIGHVQTNKVARLLGAASTLHSVDRASLVQEIDKRHATTDGATPLDVLVQVNVAAEPQKSGCRPEDLGDLLERIEQCPNSMRLVGLMTMPPHSEDPNVARTVFDDLRRLRDAHGGVARLPELSMGMSNDLEEAVMAGATMVRVGTAIFGERPK